MNEVDICLARLRRREEGDRQFAYNDATGKRVTCKPNGNLSIGIGINLENGLDEEEREWLTRHRLLKMSSDLCRLSWYLGLDAVRRSVCLDIAFNEGEGGLLHFPHMISALAQKDWKTAKDECAIEERTPLDKVVNETRYKPLGEILLTGVDQ